MPPNARGGHLACQPDSRPNVDAHANGPDAVMVKHDGDGQQAAARGGSDHDWVNAMRDLVAERRDAYLDGILEGYSLGWRDGLRAGAERGTAA